MGFGAGQEITIRCGPGNPKKCYENHNNAQKP